MVELAHCLILRVEQVVRQHLLHDGGSLESGHVTNNVTTQQREVFAGNQFVKASEHQVRVRNQWVALEVFEVGQDERFLLVLTDQHEVRVAIGSTHVAALRNRKQEHRSSFCVLQELVVLRSSEHFGRRVLSGAMVFRPNLFNR